MVIYLRHPTHGTKVACSEHEAVYDEKHGWERFDPTMPEFLEQPNHLRRGRQKKVVVTEEQHDNGG